MDKKRMYMRGLRQAKLGDNEDRPGQTTGAKGDAPPTSQPSFPTPFPPSSGRVTSIDRSCKSSIAGGYQG